MLNRRKLTGKNHSRKDLFDEVEKMALKPLPEQKYELKNFAKATVMQNSHICLTQDKHYYSVPNQYVRKKVKIIYSKSDVEIYYRHQRIAFHKRDTSIYQYSTLEQHLLAKHHFILDWNPEYFIERGNEIGAEAGQIMECIIDTKKHPEQAYKICSILSLRFAHTSPPAPPQGGEHSARRLAVI